MRRFRNILVVVDGSTDDSNAIVEHARILAVQNEAQLTVSSVVKDVRHSVRLIAAPKFSAEFQELIVENHRSQLTDMATSLQDSGLHAAVRVLCGTPFLEIIRQVLSARHDLVIIGADGSDGLGQALFGSTTMHLMRKCPCPVWVLKPTQTGKFRRILAAVDPNPALTDHFALDTTIMQLSTSLAQQYVADLHIIHAWNYEYESILRSQAVYLSQTEINKFLHEIREEHRHQLEALLSRHDLSDLTYRVHLMKGNAGMMIPRLVRSQKIDLLVMGTVCRTGVEGLIMGNTAEDVLRHVDCSVLTVKPDGFRTSVTIGSRMVAP